MKTFPTCLPTDIVLTIFNFLDQADCVECLYTCRHWYSNIPSYTTKVWEQLAISPNSWTRYNNGLLQCLGPHVKKVLIDQLDACSVLYKLNSMNCNRIGTLEIKNHLYSNVMEKNSDSFNIGNIKFLNSIERFSTTLNELCIVNHPKFISATELIHRFPHLTHLTLLYDNKINHLWTEDSADNINNNNNNNNARMAVNNHRSKKIDLLANGNGNNKNKNMVYLHLKIPRYCDFKLYLIPALRQCPQLKCLLVAGSNKDDSTIQSVLTNGDSGEATQQIELDSISKLCPNLEYIMWNVHKIYFHKKQQKLKILTEWRRRTSATTLGYESKSSNDHYMTTTNNNREKTSSVQGLIFEGHITDINNIMSSSMFTRSLRTLSYLELFNVEVNRSRDWNVIISAAGTPSLLSSTSVSSLSSNNTNNLVAMQLPQHLETLKLTNLELSHEDGWLHLFSQCQNLKHLDISLGPFDMRWDRIVQGITSSLKHLQHLGLHDNDYRVAPHLDFSDCIRMLSQECKSLRCLEIHNIRISNENLLELCKIQSLQELSLQIGSLQKTSLFAFAERLSSENYDSTTTTTTAAAAALVTLKLISAHNLDDAILKKLACVKSLMFLSVLWNNQITDAGVKAFLQHNINNNNIHKSKCAAHIKKDKGRRKSLYVDQCKSVSRWGVWTSENY